MAKKIDYAKWATRRTDGRYQKVFGGKFYYDRDPERLYRRIEALQNQEAPPVMFTAVADAWFEYHTTRIAYKTHEAYTAPLRRIKTQFAGKQISEVTAGMTQAFIAELAKLQYARRTVQMHLDIIRMIYNYAIIQGHTAINPAAPVSIPNGLHTDKRQFPTEEEIEMVKLFCNSGEMGLFACFVLYTGLRKGEALAIRYSDIDFDKMTITVNKSVSYQGNRPCIKSAKTTAGNRDVVLLDALAQHLDQNGTGLLFGVNNGHMTKIQFRKRWLKYQQKTGLAVTPHQLRHAYATILYDAQIDEKAAQEMLGHSSITVTKNIYTHIRQSHRAAVSKTLNDYINNVSQNVKIATMPDNT